MIGLLGSKAVVRAVLGAPLVLFCVAPGFGLGCAYGSMGEPHERYLRDEPDVGSCPATGCGPGEPDAREDDASYPTVDTGAPPPGDSGHGTESAAPPDGSPDDRLVVGLDVGVACTLTLPSGLPACDACLSTSCCAADDACGADPDCLAFDMCLAGCFGALPDSGAPRLDAGLEAGSTACINACERTHPTGTSELAALDTCVSSACATACGGP